MLAHNVTPIADFHATEPKGRSMPLTPLCRPMGEFRAGQDCKPASQAARLQTEIEVL